MNVEIDISNVILETERLILRAWKITDLDDFFEYSSINGQVKKQVGNTIKVKMKVQKYLKCLQMRKKFLLLF